MKTLYITRDKRGEKINALQESAMPSFVYLWIGKPSKKFDEDSTVFTQGRGCYGVGGIPYEDSKKTFGFLPNPGTIYRAMIDKNSITEIV